MSDQWYYAQQGQRVGPVSEEQLKQLVASGQVQATDLVWKKGMAEWSLAASLFLPAPPDPIVPPIPPSPPPIPPQSTQQNVASKAKGLAAAMVSQGRAAARLVALQSERTKLVTITLPNAYCTLGKHVHAAGAVRTQLAQLFQRVDGLLNELKAVQADLAGKPNAEGFAEKAKAAAQATKGMAQAQVLKTKANHALGELGKAAFEQFGEQNGPSEAVQPVVLGRARLAEVDAEISRLAESNSGKIVTPKGIATAGVVVVGLLVLLVVRSMFSGAHSPSSPMSVAATDKEPLRYGNDKQPLRYGKDKEPLRYGKDKAPLRYGNDKEPLRYGDDKKLSPAASSSSQSASKKEMNRLFEILVKQIRLGMSSDEVLGLMGSPHKKKNGLDGTKFNRADPNDEEVVRKLERLEMWIWEAASDKNEFILLGFRDGNLINAETLGWSIKTGFRNADGSPLSLPR